MTSSLMDSTLTVDSSLPDPLNGASYQDAITTVIGSMAQEDTALVNDAPEGTIWKFRYATVEVYVQLTGQTDEDFLLVWAPVLSLPVARQTELMEKLLRLNWSGTLETCFALFNDQVVVMLQRTVADLSAGEISRAITLVATLADENNDSLRAEFSAAS